MSDITDKERDFIRHALGLSRSRVGYRNYYAAGSGDVEIGRALVERGMAIEGERKPFLPDAVFAITWKGFKAARKPDEAMDDEELKKMQRREARSAGNYLRPIP